MEEGAQQLNTQDKCMPLHLDATAATSKLDVKESSTALQIDELKRKLKEANEKLQIADVVNRKPEKTKRKLLHQIKRLQNQKRYV